MNAEHGYMRLKDLLLDMGEVTIAYSGGVDSTFLLKVAFDVLGNRAVGVIADSPSLPRREYNKALETADRIGIRLITIRTGEFDNPDYLDNPVNRCYFCKSELYNRIEAIAMDSRFRNVVDGSNLDDQDDYRPGMKAKREKNVRSPLKEAGLTKQHIRMLSRQLGLPTWDKDEMACLSSRFPYGEKITLEKIRMVERAEDLLADLGFRNIRARHAGHSVRLEVDPGQLSGLLKPGVRERILRELKSIGYRYITVDLEGYRRGSLNDVLQNNPGNKKVDASGKGRNGEN